MTCVSFYRRGTAEQVVARTVLELLYVLNIDRSTSANFRSIEHKALEWKLIQYIYCSLGRLRECFLKAAKLREDAMLKPE